MDTGTAGEVMVGVDDAAEPSLDDLVADIARHLEDSGEYRLTLVPRPPQRLVDLRWAALRAGRLLDRRVRVVTSRAVSAGDTPITVRVICHPSYRGVIPQMREESEGHAS